MNKIFTLWVLITFAHCVYSQKFEWLYGNTTNQSSWGYDKPRIKTDPWGNSFILGRYSGWMVNGTDSMLSFGGGANSFFLTKLDPAGNWLWSKTFSPHNSSIYDMCIDGNGYVYATIYCNGFITYNDGDTSFNFPNVLTPNKIISFDNNGKVRWGIEHPEGGSQAPLASSHSMNGFFTAGGNEICRIDTAGNIVWSKSVTGSFQFNGLEYNAQSALVASGWGSAGTHTLDTVSFILNATTADLAVFKMDISGSVLGAYVLPNYIDGSSYYFQNEMLVNSASEIYILYRKGNGLLNYVFGNDTVFNPYCPTCICGAVLKLSVSGVPLWARGIYGDGHLPVVDFILNDNEDIIITGRAPSVTYFGNHVFNNNYGLGYFETFFAAKLLSNGNYSWFKSDSRIIGQLAYDMPYGIAKGLNNTYIVMGSRQISLAPAFQLGCLSDSNPNEGFFAVNISEGTEPVPSADFEYTMTGATLIAHRPDEPNVTYGWNYGDGSPASTHIKTLHQYAQPGVYNLCLSATNNCGTNTKCEQVNYAGIRTIISNRGGQGGVIDVNIYGGGFTANTTFKLIKSGVPDIIPVSDSVLNSGQLWGRLDLRNVALGLYDVEVTGPAGGPFVLPNAFTVEPLRPAFISVTASSNRASRINTWNKSTVTLTNEGNENALMVPLFIEFPIDLDFFYFGSPIDRHSINGIQQGNDSIDLAGWFHLDKIAAADSQFYINRISQLIPHILPGQSLSFDFYIKSAVGAEIRRMVQVRQPLFPSAALLDNTIESHDSSAHVFMYKTSRNWYGSPVDSVLYIQTLKNVLRQYANAFASHTTGNGGVGSNGGSVGGMNTVGGGGYSGFASGRQPSGTPTYPPKILPVLVQGCSSCCSGPNCSALPPPAANFPPPPTCASNGCCTGCNAPPAGFGGKPRTPYNPPPGGGCYPCPSGDLDDILFWANSFDPNAKYGPQQNGDIYLNDIQNKSYTITFENLSTATAPAQTVIVIDTLDAARFDFSTFRFGSISIGDSLFVTLEEKNYKQVHITNLNPLMNLWVAIEASFDTVTGIAKWEFTSIDPITKTTPVNPLVGFLPPNMNQNEGNGSVSFICSYKPSLLTGDSVLNHAIIYFDNNAPIVTNVYFNILDFTPPVSSVNTLPPTVTNDTILLTLSGSDNLSGIAYYELFVSVNDGPFESFGKFNTNVIQYVGSSGNQYEFYSIAFDKAGNMESPPANPETNPDAVTTIILTSMNDISGKPDILIYPNPAKSVLNIRSSESLQKISLCDLPGKQLLENTLNGEQSLQLRLHQLNSGIYFLKCETLSGSAVIERILIY